MFFLRLRLSEFCVILSEQTYVLGGDIMLIQENLSVQEKLKILTDAAKYDVACTSSGVRYLPRCREDERTEADCKDGKTAECAA